LLGTAVAYSGFLRLVRAERFFARIAEDHLRLVPGDEILDLGCGDGALSEHVGDARYTGIDHNRAYVDMARRRHAAPGRTFVCADLADFADPGSGVYDVVSLVGVLHHLDDALAVEVLCTALQLLAPNGRIVSVDPVFHPEQRAIARVLMALDRGRYVRHPPHYLHLAGQTGARVTHTVRFDLNPFPYTHLIMELSGSCGRLPVR
jgi:2-polyprenyl-3-methyl-5-hydroxy-6-metoxy-1,4-benzoquinol methylase